MRRDYELAAQVGTKEAWNSFLSIHSGGFYADLARGQRGKLLAEESKLASRTEPPATKSLTTTPPTRNPANRHRHRSETRCAGDAIATDHRDRPRASHRSGAEQAPTSPTPRGSCTPNCGGSAAIRARSMRHGAAIHAARWNSSTATRARTSTPSWQASTRSVWCAPRPAGSARWNAGRVSEPTTTPASGSSAAQATVPATMASASASGRRNPSLRRGRGSARRPALQTGQRAARGALRGQHRSFAAA